MKAPPVIERRGFCQGCQTHDVQLYEVSFERFRCLKCCGMQS